MDTESLIDPLLGEVPSGLTEIVAHLEEAAGDGSVRYAIDESTAPNCRKHLERHVAAARASIARGDSESAWYSVARAVELIGFCKGAASTRYAVEEEARSKARDRTASSHASQRKNEVRRTAEIAAKVSELPPSHPGWRNIKVLEGAISEAILRHPEKLKDTSGRIAKVLAHPMISERVAGLQPVRARRSRTVRAEPEILIELD